MPTIADHFAAILKDATLHHTSLDLGPGKDLYSLLRSAANDPNAAGAELAEGDGPEQILKKIKDSLEKHGPAVIDPRLASKLAQAVGFSELPGDRPYETFDPGWIECLLNYYKYRNDKIKFPSPAKPGDVVQALINKPALKIGIVGDWGTGGPIAKSVIDAMQEHKPDYAIHLGDVYYSGDSAQETANFLQAWCFPEARSYALNSNHEMYSGGRGYYGTLLKDSKFASQQGIGYFALTNDQWLIIGLDSAYFTASHLYQDGALCRTDLTDPQAEGMVQVEWLKWVLQEHPQKRVILMTHHDGFDVSPSTGKVTTKPLYRQVSALMQGIKDWWWYWGHVHTVIAYQQIFLPHNSTVSTRCVGHGAIPYMPFQRDLHRLGGGDVKVTWAETDLARDPAIPLRAPCGFLLLTLTGADLKEEFYDENNRQRWSNH